MERHVFDRILAERAAQAGAEVPIKTAATGDPSTTVLDRFEGLWQRDPGRKMARNGRLRERFSRGQRADKRFVRAVALAVGG